MGGYGLAIINGVIQTGGTVTGLATMARATRQTYCNGQIVKKFSYLVLSLHLTCPPYKW
jgi:hypothetical protein